MYWCVRHKEWPLQRVGPAPCLPRFPICGVLTHTFWTWLRLLTHRFPTRMIRGSPDLFCFVTLSRRVETDQKCPRLSVQICFTNNRIFPCKHDQLSVVGLFLYHLLLPHMKSDSFQNLPFCFPKHDKQGHTLLVAAMPTTPQSSFQPFALLPPLSEPKFKISGPQYVGKRQTKSAPFDFSKFQHGRHEKEKKSTFVSGTNFCTRQKPRLVSFLYC